MAADQHRTYQKETRESGGETLKQITEHHDI